MMTHPADRTEQYRADMRHEQVTLDRLETAAARIADLVAADPWLWDRGDGNGGFVASRIIAAMAARGFEIER